MNSLPSEVYGLLAEFESPELLREAARSAHQAGYRRMDAFTPIPIDGLSDALGHDSTSLPLITFLGGIFGGLSGYGLQYYAAVVAYPLNIGGRPLNSWPAFIPVIFETTVLGAALAAVLGMLALNGLPRPHHPLFNVPQFLLASRDRFFLCIEARDSAFCIDETRIFLEGLRPRSVLEVPR
jgi:hypothetical protein